MLRYTMLCYNILYKARGYPEICYSTERSRLEARATGEPVSRTADKDFVPELPPPPRKERPRQPVKERFVTFGIPAWMEGLEEGDDAAGPWSRWAPKVL